MSSTSTSTCAESVFYTVGTDGKRKYKRVWYRKAVEQFPDLVPDKEDKEKFLGAFEQSGLQIDLETQKLFSLLF